MRAQTSGVRFPLSSNLVFDSDWNKLSGSLNIDFLCAV